MKKIIELTKDDVRDALVGFVEDNDSDYLLTDSTKMVFRFSDQFDSRNEVEFKLDDLMNVTLVVED